MHDWLLSFGERIENFSWVTALSTWPQLFPAVSAAHYFSFFLLVGAIVVVDLRILGLGARRQTVSHLAVQVSPWMWTGLGLAVVTGLILSAPSAGELLPTPWYWLKLLVILLAVVAALIVQGNIRKWDQLPAIPTSAKVMAFLSLALWIGAILAATEIAQHVNI